MKISIVTAAYNAAATIAETLGSVAAQSHPDIEHIVVDGASRDGTQAIVQSQAKGVAKFISEPDQGIYDAMNKGLALATGDIIGTLNADDLYADFTILEQVAAVFADPCVEACYGDLVYVSQDDTSRIVRHWRSREMCKGWFARGGCPPHPTFFVRRQVYEKFGGFDLSYHLAADFELMLRLLEREKIVAQYIPKVWVRMRLGGATNKSLRNVLVQNKEIFLAFSANGVPYNLMVFLFGKLINRIGQFFPRSEMAMGLDSMPVPPRS